MSDRLEPPKTLAETRHVSKQFGAITAVKDVSCTFRAGEIHAVCGENGAGKSTLLKLVAGMLTPEPDGEVLVQGSILEPHTPREAIARRVAMVLQHFALVPVFTVLENIILGAEPLTAGGFVIDEAKARTRIKAIAKDLGVGFDVDARVEDLGIGDRQRIEIARALYRDAELVILDEPTAVLTKAEARSLYETVRRLADNGKGIVVVTHKMDEVRAHADIVTVMRKGELVFTRPLDRSGGDEGVRKQVDEVTAAIMGAVARRSAVAKAESERPAAPSSSSQSNATGEAPPSSASTTDQRERVLTMKDVRVGRGLNGASLTLHAGEIIGVAGVEGNGQKELVAVLAGDMPPDEGSIEGGPFGVIREDRQTEGLVLDASLRDNIMLGELGRFAGFRPIGVLDTTRLEQEARARLERSGAPKDDLDRTARTLSGGNQQKIVVARALAREGVKVVVASQPTRGVDLAASLDIHEELTFAAKRGAGVLVISSDLDELKKLSSRILVLARGKIVRELAPSVSDEEIGKLMLGIDARNDDEHEQAHA